MIPVTNPPPPTATLRQTYGCVGRESTAWTNDGETANPISVAAAKQRAQDWRRIPVNPSPPPPSLCQPGLVSMNFIVAPRGSLSVSQGTDAVVVFDLIVH